MQFTVIKRVVFVLILFLSVALSASDIKITNFTISRAIDTKQLKGIGVSDNFGADIREISASAVIHNIFPPTEFLMQWYYKKDNQKVKLYQDKFQVSGTRFIYSTVEVTKGRHLPKGNYGVAITMNGKRVALKEFTIGSKKESSSSKVRNCTKPTKADNKLLIDDIYTEFKVLKNELEQMKLKRYGDDEFSLLAPSGWRAKKQKARGKLLELICPCKGVATAYMLLEIPIDSSFIKKHSLQKSVLTAATLIKQDALSKGGKVLLAPKLYALPNLMAARIMFVYSKKGVNIFELHTLIFDGKRMFDVVLATDKNGLEISKFLSLLASYSFWTVQSCK